MPHGTVKSKVGYYAASGRMPAMIPVNATDEELLRRMPSEPEALEVLYQRWGGRWAGLIRAAGVSTQDVADVLQSILVEVWQHAARFDRRRGSCESWLLQIARFRTIDFLRRQKPQSLAWSEDVVVTMPTDNSGDVRPWVDEAMARLSERERRVLQLMYYGGFTQKEIAAMWNVPHGTVKSWASRALEKLRRHLSEERRP